MKIIVLIVLDVAAFLLSLLLTFIVYNGFNIFAFSAMIFKAYFFHIIFLVTYFIVILNLFSLYNIKKTPFSIPRILLVISVYFASLFIFSYIYPKYQFSRMLLFINLTVLYFFITITRVFAQKIISNKELFK